MKSIALVENEKFTEEACCNRYERHLLIMKLAPIKTISKRELVAEFEAL